MSEGSEAAASGLGGDSPMSQVEPEPARREPRRAARPALTGEQLEAQGMLQDRMGNEVQFLFLSFLDEYEDEEGKKVYVEALDPMEEHHSTTLNVDWQHLRPDSAEDRAASGRQKMVDLIQTEYYRFEPYLRRAVQNFVRTHKPNYVLNGESNAGEDKEFFVSIYNFHDLSKLRDLKTQRISQLTAFGGTVTRTTEVRPELQYGTFSCGECGHVMPNVHQQFKFTEPKMCLNTNCTNTNNWDLDIPRSKFVDWQKCRVQEYSHDIPPGSMPRSIDVILRNEQVEGCKPGDKCVFTGTLIVVPDVGSYMGKGPRAISMPNERPGSAGAEGVTGLKALGVRELTYRLVFLANAVKPDSEAFGTVDIRDDENAETDDLSPEERKMIMEMKDKPKLYERMSDSLAPNIFGHPEIKRGILLMLFGGVRKFTKDGGKLRGDVNICIVGDPSTAKSQFLKYVTRILPRTVYTSGKASTSAGLTASVQRDPETGEFGIQAGALMLADNGICCIDEFDKMDELDQAAIHEAMEQQTISITKAGIQATLNARASILAAANPMWGRYDTSKPLRYNVNITPPLMSRFDLFFVIVDECDQATDFHVGQHIVRLHTTGQDVASDADFTPEQIQSYIRYARGIRPKITPEARQHMVRFYRQLRQRDATEQHSYRFTVRQLESMIRLSEAIARVHLDDKVTKQYVIEAARLLRQSIVSIDAPDVVLEPLVEAPEAKAPEPAADGAEPMDVDGEEKEEEGAEAAAAAPAAPEEPVSIAVGHYTRTAGQVVYVVRHHEPEPDAGITQKALEDVIMEDKAESVEDEVELAREHKVLRLIIQRLVETDHILVVRRPAADVADRVLMVHPNYDTGNGPGASSALDRMAASEEVPEAPEEPAPAEERPSPRRSPRRRGRRAEERKEEEPEEGGEGAAGDEEDARAAMEYVD